MILQGGKVLFFMMQVSILWEAVVIVMRELFILFAGLNLTSIAFLPKGKVKVAAIIAYPITLAGLALCFGLVFAGLVLLFERGEKLMHFGFLLFGFKIIGKCLTILLRPIKWKHGYWKRKAIS